MKPVMYIVGQTYYFFDDAEKLKEFLAVIPTNANYPYHSVQINRTPKIKGWNLHVYGNRGDSTDFQDAKNTRLTTLPNFDTLEDALTYLEESYKAFIGDDGLKAMFDKKTFSKTIGFARFTGTLTPVWE